MVAKREAQQIESKYGQQQFIRWMTFLQSFNYWHRQHHYELDIDS